MLKLDARISKFFTALVIIFKVLTKLFWWSNKIVFRSVSSKILAKSFSKIFPCIILIFDVILQFSLNYSQLAQTILSIIKNSSRFVAFIVSLRISLRVKCDECTDPQCQYIRNDSDFEGSFQLQSSLIVRRVSRAFLRVVLMRVLLLRARMIGKCAEGLQSGSPKAYCTASTYRNDIYTSSSISSARISSRHTWCIPRNVCAYIRTFR